MHIYVYIFSLFIILFFAYYFYHLFAISHFRPQNLRVARWTLNSFSFISTWRGRQLLFVRLCARSLSLIPFPLYPRLLDLYTLRASSTSHYYHQRDSRDCHDSPLPLYRMALRLVVSAPCRARTRWRNSGVGIERDEGGRGRGKRERGSGRRCGGVGRGVGCACGHFDNLPLLRLAPSFPCLSLSSFFLSRSISLAPSLPPFLSFQSSRLPSLSLVHSRYMHAHEDPPNAYRHVRAHAHLFLSRHARALVISSRSLSPSFIHSRERKRQRVIVVVVVVGRPVTAVASVADFPFSLSLPFLFPTLPRSFSLPLSLGEPDTRSLARLSFSLAYRYIRHPHVAARAYVRVHLALGVRVYLAPRPAPSLPPASTGRCQFLVDHRLVRNVRFAFYVFSVSFMRHVIVRRASRLVSSIRSSFDFQFDASVVNVPRVYFGEREREIIAWQQSASKLPALLPRGHLFSALRHHW